MKTLSPLSSTRPSRGSAARRKIAIVYNEPVPGTYDDIGEQKAILSILEGVVAAHQSLEELGYEVVRVPLLPPVEEAREILKALDTDLVFNLFEGFDTRPKTEATIAGILSELGFRYTGCSSAALAMGLDKVKSKDLMRSHGIHTPDYQKLTPETVGAFRLRFPCIVKPSGQDASHGLSANSVVSDRASMERQVAVVSRSFGGDALVEEFVDGREFNVTVIGNRQIAVLPISEILYDLPPGVPPVLTYAAKWEEDTFYFNRTRVACPADIDLDQSSTLFRTAVDVFRLVVKRGYARVDMRLDADGTPQVLEANPNPDITPGSGAARQAAAAGMTYTQFVDRLVAMARHKTPV
jgi:D-alanine-D-alanine ligase